MAGRKNFPNRVEARKLSAKTRQEAYDKLSPEARFVKATVGSREHAKLLKKAK